MDRQVRPIRKAHLAERVFMHGVVERTLHIVSVMRRELITERVM